MFWQNSAIHRLPPRAPHVPVHGRRLVHFGGCKSILCQIIGKAELLISLILGWGTNKDLPVSRVRVDVVVFPFRCTSVTLSGGSVLRCCCRCGVLAMTVLNPAAESRFSVCCVSAQPNAMATSAMAPMRFNPVNICFMAFPFFIVSFGLFSYLF